MEQLTFNGVIEWQDVHALAVLDVVTRLDSAEIAKLDAQVIPCH